MLRALLALLLVASPLGGASHGRIDSARYADAWARVQSCSGRAPLPGHSLEQLVVIAEPEVSIGGHRVLARWVDGDSMFVTAGIPDTGWVVRHELLHMLMQGPAPPSDPHPMDPFAFPCKLLERQQPGAHV
jgi:hypothetical protein